MRMENTRGRGSKMEGKRTESNSALIKALRRVRIDIRKPNSVEDCKYVRLTLSGDVYSHSGEQKFRTAGELPVWKGKIPPYPEEFLNESGRVDYKAIRAAERRLKKDMPSYRQASLWKGQRFDYLRLRASGIVDVRQTPGVGALRFIARHPHLWSRQTTPLSIAHLKVRGATLEYLTSRGDHWARFFEPFFERSEGILVEVPDWWLVAAAGPVWAAVATGVVPLSGVERDALINQRLRGGHVFFDGRSVKSSQA